MWQSCIPTKACSTIPLLGNLICETIPLICTTENIEFIINCSGTCALCIVQYIHVFMYETYTVCTAKFSSYYLFCLARLYFFPKTNIPLSAGAAYNTSITANYKEETHRYKNKNCSKLMYMCIEYNWELLYE